MNANQPDRPGLVRNADALKTLMLLGNNRHRPLLSRTLKTESVGRGFEPRPPHLTTYHLGRRLMFRPLQTDHCHPGGVVSVALDADACGEGVEVGDLVCRSVATSTQAARPIFIPHECRRSRHPKFHGIATSSGAKHGGTGGRCAERSMHVGREWRRWWDGWKGLIR
jgi:hypothetical protein